MPGTAAIQYQMAEPVTALAAFVKCFWSVYNAEEEPQSYTILPDGHFDLLLRCTADQSMTVSLTGLGTHEFECRIPGRSRTTGISFKLPAADYILNTSLQSIVDNEMPLGEDFWGITPKDLLDFQGFVSKLTTHLLTMPLKKEPDLRLFELSALLYQSQGSMKVEAMANTIHWSSRQLNRYFQSRFGISLKTYCNILRYRASFDQLKKKQLFPDGVYADQVQFIREVRKHSGVSPKTLSANKDSRFIQLAVLPEPSLDDE